MLERILKFFDLSGCGETFVYFSIRISVVGFFEQNGVAKIGIPPRMEDGFPEEIG